MARYSNAHSGHAPMVFGSWVLAKAACAALAITAVAVLAGCGGGGGAATPDTPTVTPSAVTLTLVSAKVMLADGGNNVVVYTALGNKGADGGNIDITATTTWVPTFMGQALEAGATLSVATNGHVQKTLTVGGVTTTTDVVVTHGVTVSVAGTATYGGKTITVPPTILTGGCETGLVATGGKC